MFTRKPRLLDEAPKSDSRIVLATASLADKLVARHREPDALRTIDRRLFEQVIAELFSGFGYRVELTAATRDGGRDIIALGTADDIHVKYLVECKRPDPGNPVGVGIVRQLLGVVEDERATKGIVVATTYFTSDAQAFERRNRWRLELKEYEQIVDWITRYIRLKGK